jgi:hypothetical protein
MKDVHEAALDYAKRGHFVFPAKFAGRQKLGHTSAEKSNGNPWGYTKDPEEIREYWRRWPHAAIGLPTGAVNGMFVIDVDTLEGHDHDGNESLDKLQMEHGDLTWTRVAESPTGSKHYYFKQPPGTVIPSTASKLGPGIDVRGDGGFVMAAPSVRPGRGEYAWINHVAIAHAPRWLLDLVTARPRVLQTGDFDHELQAMIEADSGKGVPIDPGDNAFSAPISAEEFELKIRVALSVVPSDEYDVWYRIGAAAWRC